MGEQLHGRPSALPRDRESRGRAADYKNLQRPSVGWSAKPFAWLDLSADYMPAFANENTFAGTTGYWEATVQDFEHFGSFEVVADSG